MPSASKPPRRVARARPSGGSSAGGGGPQLPGSPTAAFNALLKDFLQELAGVFPEYAEIRLFLAGFDAAVHADEAALQDRFVAALAPHEDLLAARDPALFDQPLSVGLDLGKLWASRDVSEATRDAIWRYVQSLYGLGVTARALPDGAFADAMRGVTRTLSEDVVPGLAADAAAGLVSGQEVSSEVSSKLVEGVLRSLPPELAGQLDLTPDKVQAMQGMMQQVMQSMSGAMASGEMPSMSDIMGQAMSIAASQGLAGGPHALAGTHHHRRPRDRDAARLPRPPHPAPK